MANMQERKMETQVDPANVQPGEQVPVPTNKDDLLIEALRAANRVSGLLNELSAMLMDIPEGHAANAETVEKLSAALLRRFSDCSGVHLFIAANNLGIDLPPDLTGERDADEHWEDE
jgi:hypothetical protein